MNLTEPVTSLFECLWATWPAASSARIGPWVINGGQGGGQRVSAARRVAEVSAEDIPMAEAAMKELKQVPIFLIRDAEDDALDGMLADRGYMISDPTMFMDTVIAPLLDAPVPPVTAFSIWPPLQIMRELWISAGTDTARLAIMERAEGRKTGLLGRVQDRAAAVGFLGIHEETAMLHALEVAPEFRRKGLARHLVRKAAMEARELGATRLALAVTRANAPAIALYTQLGMAEAGGYHYRVASKTPT